MIVSNNGYLLIEKYESFRSYPYKCEAGVPTIGYGSTFYMNGTAVTMNDQPISKEQALILLQYVVNKFSQKINKLVIVQLTQNQFDALIDFTYNIGIPKFAGSTLLKYLNKGLYTEAANQFPLWCHVKRKVSSNLLDRRLTEKKLFLS